MLVADNFNREFLELWLYRHKLERNKIEKIMSENEAASISPSYSSHGFIVIQSDQAEGVSVDSEGAESVMARNVTGEPDLIQGPPSHQSSAPGDVPPAVGNDSRLMVTSSSLEDFYNSFEQALAIAQHAERAKSEARTAIERADTARSLAEQAWGQAMAAAEAAQSIARSGLAVAKLSLDACNARSSQNGRGQSSDHLKGAFDLFARQKQPIMTYDKFQAALGLAEDDIDDDGVSREITLEFNSGNVGSDYHTCGSQEVPPQLNFYDANQGNQAASTLQLSQQLSRNTNIRQDADASRNVSNQKQNFVPKRFEKYLTPLGHTSGASSARTQKLANPCDGLQGKTCGTNPSSTNQIAERFYRLHAAAPPARAQTSASDELEPSAFWRPNDVTGTDTSSRRSKKDPYLADDGASSDDSTRSAPTSLEVRCRRTESSDEGSSPPLKPRQLQRLSDMEPTEENMMTRLQQQARRSQSCSSEPGADATRKRPCSPLVLPETDSGSNVQMLPNNVQAFQPAMAKSTTPPTSYHGNVTSSGRAYLSD